MVSWIKRHGKLIVCLVLFLTGCFCMWRIHSISGALISQQGAERWGDKEHSYAQVSAFFLQEAGISENAISGYRSQIQKSLEEASITGQGDAPKGTEKGRLWVDGYSAEGESLANRGGVSQSVDLIGVGGDFFLFHPQSMLSGYYFASDEAMKDRVVIDETLAWKLFGSPDVEGMNLTLGGKPCIVAGVYRTEEGREEDAAMGERAKVFIPLELLTELTGNSAITCYEILLPNPVSDFAKQLVLKNIAGVDLSSNTSNDIDLENMDIKVIDNTSRYSIKSLLGVIKNTGIRSMSRQNISYPYWENIARAKEDYCSYWLLGGALCFLPPLVLTGAYGVKRWRNRKWTVKRLWEFVLAKQEERVVKNWEKRQAEENNLTFSSLVVHEDEQEGSVKNTHSSLNIWRRWKRAGGSKNEKNDF